MGNRMSPMLIIAGVLFGSVLLIGVVSGQSTSLTSGTTLVPNTVINAIIQALNRQTGIRGPDTAQPRNDLIDRTRSLRARIAESIVARGSNRREPDPLGTTSGRLSPTDEFIRRQKPIDEIIEQAESNFTLLRLADQRQLRRQGSTVIEGDIVIDLLELADIDKQIRLDEQEEQILKRFPAVRLDDTVFRDRIRSILEKRGTTLHVRRKRAARRGKRWPLKLVPVRIASSGFSRAEKSRIAAAMDEISERTCICFNIMSRTQILQGIPHVRIVNGNGCRSRIGRDLRIQDGRLSQDLSLTPKCRVKPVVTHEFLHALGLYHEQERPDRWRRVRVLMRNVKNNQRGNFRRLSRKTVNSYGIPYDYRSIMHYSSKAFSKNNRYTIIPRPRRNRRRYIDVIGKATEMSTNDARAINRMYDCPTQIAPRCADYPYRFP